MLASSIAASDLWAALIVGCGRIGGSYNTSADDPHVLGHALAYVRHPRFQLLACVDPDHARRREFMHRWGVPRGFSSLDEALADGEYDIVSVATPTSAHLDTLSGLSGAHIRALFVEKPVGGDPTRAAPLVRHFTDRGIAFAVNFQRRWDPEMQLLRQEIANGEWGPLRTVVGRYVRGIMNNGGHMVNLLAFLLDEIPRVVDARHVRWDGVEDDPTVDARLELVDGTPIHLIGSDGRDWPVFDLRLSFARGEVAIDKFGFEVTRRRLQSNARVPGGLALDGGAVVQTGYGGAMLHALDEILAWQPGRRLASDGWSALETLAVNQRLRDVALSDARET